MSRNAAYILGMLLTIIVGTLLYFNFCSECQPVLSETETSTTEQVEVETIPEPTFFPFSVQDGDYAFEVNDNFNFDISTENFNLPISENVENGIESLKSYLNENPEKIINITGLYKSDEPNNTAFPNLGKARANAVKNYLVSKGILSSQTNTSGHLLDDLIADGNTFFGPVNYSIDNRSENADEELKLLHDEILANPLVLYFETGEAAINLTAEQRQKIANISKYLDKVDDARCLVIGHTDNTGNRTTNIGLGQDRANFAKSYLVRNGIADEKIVSSSKGPDQPIASNDTEEGRSKNRRVEVTLN